MPTSHIQRSPAEIVDQPNVAEFKIRQGVERIFCLKCTLSHFGRGSGGAFRKLVIRNRPAPCERRPIPKNHGGARSDRADSGRHPGENALFSSQRGRPASVLDMWRPLKGDSDNSVFISNILIFWLQNWSKCGHMTKGIKVRSAEVRVLFTLPLFLISWMMVQWNLVITRTLGPWKLPCYIRFLIISG